MAGTTFDTMRGVRVVTVGDIACAPGQAETSIACRDDDTARLAKQFRPRWVLPLGDLQYDNGEFEDFQKAYAQTWGKLLAISRPVPGNHDYLEAGAAGYLEYFKAQTGGRNYYAFDIGDWRYYALDSNCEQMDCAGEAVWLDKDMTANPRKCTAIAMHHPRYSSGTDPMHGDRLEVRPLWGVALLHHADLALAGHEHQYQRFRAMDADGHLTDDGLVSFVVGTGGKSLYEKGRPERGEVLAYNARAGVLDLKLGKAGFGWRFRNVDGKTIDEGVQACH
jgi:acid phosphatase type 7